MQLSLQQPFQAIWKNEVKLTLAAKLILKSNSVPDVHVLKVKKNCANLLQKIMQITQTQPWQWRN